MSAAYVALRFDVEAAHERDQFATAEILRANAILAASPDRDQVQMRILCNARVIGGRLIRTPNHQHSDRNDQQGPVGLEANA